MLVSGPALTAAAAIVSRPAEAAPGLVLLPAGDDGVEVVARFFRALADPARLRLLEFLLPAEHTVTECVAQVGLSQGRVSAHLACLAGCGYVQARRQGRNTFYRVPGRWPPTTPPRWRRACPSPRHPPDRKPQPGCYVAAAARAWPAGAGGRVRHR
jgi:DNA-binding transcriptional ArsR family regulator